MDSIDVAVKKLRSQIHEVESQLAVLKLQLTQIEQSASSNPANPRLLSASQPNLSPNQPTAPTANGDRRWPLDAEEYKRYGRQMIVPEIGLKGYLNICSITRIWQLMRYPHRSTWTEERVNSNNWHWWTRMSCCSVPCWSGGRHLGFTGWGYCRDIESTSPNIAYFQPNRLAEGG